MKELQFQDAIVIEETKAPVKTEAGVMTVERKVQDGLIAFDNKRKELTELANTAKLLKVTDINDKKQLDVVSTARKQLKAQRVAIEKQGKELRDNVTVISKNISAKEKELVGIISPIEDQLQSEEDRVTKELEFIRTEAERKEKEILQARYAALVSNGCAFDGLKYSIADLSINDTQLKVMDDGLFGVFLDKVKLEHERVLQMEAEKERERLAELARIEEERKIEAARMEKEKAELLEGQRKLAEAQAKQREEFEAEQKKVREENERIAAEQKVKQDELDRQAREIQAAKDEADRIERERLQRIEDERIAAENEKLRIERERLEAIAAEQKRLQDEKDEADRIEAENKRQAELAPDKDKLQNYAKALTEIATPELSTEEGKAILKDAIDLVTKIHAFVNKKVKSL